jgi:hypothetical protein
VALPLALPLPLALALALALAQRSGDSLWLSGSRVYTL